MDREQNIPETKRVIVTQPHFDGFDVPTKTKEINLPVGEPETPIKDTEIPMDDETQPYDASKLNKQQEEEKKEKININKTSSPEELYGKPSREVTPHWSDR